MITEEIRSYEVSLWTLQDEFITVLKWSDVEQEGRIQEPKMVLKVDGTEELSFSIPMYLYYRVESPKPHLEKRENPIWYNTRNGNLIAGMRKIKVTFNKYSDDEEVFEFLITKVTEEHEKDQLFCRVECEGLAFHELGKRGYKYDLSQDNFELDNKAWKENGVWTKRDGTEVTTQPIENVQYWCEQCDLTPLPSDPAEIDPTRWYYKIDMHWDSFNGTSANRDSNIVYEEEFASSWSSTLIPQEIEAYKEKARPVKASESNIYNITQTIAETFEIYCRYEYGYDENYHINSRTIIFYNNFIRDRDQIISFTYPYSSKSVTRTMDCADIVTKMFVRSEDDDTTLEGQITIANSEANKTKEDYLLDFEYMYSVGAITKEQYDSIHEYEMSMRQLNEQLINYSLELDSYEKEKLQADADAKILNESIALDTEQLDNSYALYNRLDASDGEEDGYFTKNNKNPYKTLIRTDNLGQYYITFNEQDKGIDGSSIKIYRTYNSATQVLSNQIAANKISTRTDEYGDINKIVLVNYTIDPSESLFVYITYRYQPELYYDKVIQAWERKLATDQEDLEVLVGEGGTIPTLTAAIENTKASYDAALVLKNKKIKDFEHMMGPALREGYWQPEEYKDYGDNKSADGQFNSNYVADKLIPDAGTEMIVGWDNEPFSTESKFYYEEGVNLDKVYYPCIDVTSKIAYIGATLAEGSNSRVSFIYNNNFYKTITQAEANLLQNIGHMTLGGEAELQFVRLNNTIKLMLVLTGAKHMTEDEIIFMLSQDKGKPRLGIISTTFDNNNIPTTTVNATAISASDIYWKPSLVSSIGNIEPGTNRARENVYPRIKFSTLRLKVNDNDLKINYNNIPIYKYTDFSVLNRTTTRQNKAYPEYFITLKPETMVRLGTITGAVHVEYNLSNAATNILLDAKQIMNDSSKPKVSYTVTMNMVNKVFIRTLYKQLAQLAMINDTELKFENVFGYISELELDLDQPQNDTIEVKNYKTKFEDLFSTIVAETEEMKKNGSLFAAAAAGDIPISSVALENTLEENFNIIQEYIDSGFYNSQVVKDTLASLFTEASEILADANSELNSVHRLSVENAAILNGFAKNIASTLTPRVYNSPVRPTTFKSGDIWNQVDEHGVVIGRYIATSGSEDGDGFTRTYDGTLAAIRGASLNIDTVAGTIELLAQNQIDIKSGGYLYLAGENVNIVGNKQVNIGGATINLGAFTVDGATYEAGGINLFAGNSISNSSSYVVMDATKIDIAGGKLKLEAASTIEMIASQGSAANTATIKLDANEGVWIGSGKKVSIFSGTNNSGANIQMTPDHILMGTTSGTTGSIFELKPAYLLMGVGNTTNTNFDSSNVTLASNTSLTGIKLTKDSFGLAVGASTSRTVILANQNGFTVGTGDNPVTAGSYVQIAGNGVTIGSTADLTINANNFKLQTNTSASGIGNTILAVGSNLNGITNNTEISSLTDSSTVDFLINKKGVFVKGRIYASSGSFTGAVYASSGTFKGDVTADTFTATCTNGKFKANGASLGFYGSNDAAILTINSNGKIVASDDLSISSGKNLSISSNNFIINTGATGTNSMLYVANNATWSSATSGIKYSPSGGLEVKGSIVATSFTLNGHALQTSDISDFQSAVNTAVTNAASSFTANGLDYSDNWNNTGKKFVTLTSSTGLLIGSNNGIVVPSANNASGLSNPYLKIDESGIVLNGKHILINGKQEWSRDDIIVMSSNPNDQTYTIAGVESMMANAEHDWVLIKPYYDAEISYSAGNYSQQNNTAFIFPGSFTSQQSFATITGINYTYSFTCEITTSASMQANDCALYLSNTPMYTYQDVQSNDNKITVTFNPSRFFNTTPLKVSGSLESSTNLFGDGATIYFVLRVGGAATNISNCSFTDLRIVGECPSTSSRVPCTVYYYPVH